MYKWFEGGFKKLNAMFIKDFIMVLINSSYIFV